MPPKANKRKRTNGDESGTEDTIPNQEQDAIKVRNEKYDQTLTFGDVGGLEEMKLELITSVIHGFIQMNGSLPKGILFHGLPGTGKTWMANCLISEINRSLNKKKKSLSLYILDGSCKNKYYGQSEKIMRETFKEATLHAPSIILMDEIESLASSRDQCKEDSSSSVVSQLLLEVGQISGKVLVIGITNILSKIDPALIRPGRLEGHYQFFPPGVHGRVEIIQSIIKNWPLQARPNEEVIRRTAEVTPGYTGADLQKLAKKVQDKAKMNACKGNISCNDVQDVLAKLNSKKAKINQQDWIIEGKKMKATSSLSFGSYLYNPETIFCPKLMNCLCKSTCDTIMDAIPHEAEFCEGNTIRTILIWTKCYSKQNDINNSIIPLALSNLMDTFALYTIPIKSLFAREKTRAELMYETLSQAVNCERPSIVFIPDFDHLWEEISVITEKKVLLRILEKAKNNRVLFIASTSSKSDSFQCSLLQNLFDEKVSSSVEVATFSNDDIEKVLQEVFQKALKKLAAFQQNTQKRKPKSGENLRKKLEEEFQKLVDIAIEMDIQGVKSLIEELDIILTSNDILSAEDLFDGVSELLDSFN